MFVPDGEVDADEEWALWLSEEANRFKMSIYEKLEQKDEEMCVITFFNFCRYTGPKTGLKGEKEGKFHRESISMDFFSDLLEL